jgi:hypothetical protein
MGAVTLGVVNGEFGKHLRIIQLLLQIHPLNLGSCKYFPTQVSDPSPILKSEAAAHVFTLYTQHFIKTLLVYLIVLVLA